MLARHDLADILNACSGGAFAIGDSTIGNSFPPIAARGQRQKGNGGQNAQEKTQGHSKNLRRKKGADNQNRSHSIPLSRAGQSPKVLSEDVFLFLSGGKFQKRLFKKAFARYD